MILRYSSILLISLLGFNCAFAQDKEFHLDGTPTNIPGNFLEYIKVDKGVSFDSVVSLRFKPSNSKILNLGISNKSSWIKLKVSNNSNDSLVRFNIPVASLDSVIVYYPMGGKYSYLTSGERVHVEDKQIKDPFQSFLIPVSDTSTTIYFRVVTSEQLIFPLSVIANNTQFVRRSIFYGIFSGVILALLLYNLVLAFLIREQVYYVYLFFLFSIYFAQANLIGLSYYFLSWSPDLNHLSVYIFSSVVGLSALRFMELFLDVKSNYSNSMKFINIGYVLYVLLFILAILRFDSTAYLIMQVSGMYAAIVALGIGFTLTIKGNILAKFYLAAWSIFSVGIIIYVLKDYGILPYNNFTKLTMTYGVIIEVILLSIALAHRINTLKKDNEKAQERIIEEMSRSENLIKNQNIILEDKVKKRTEELEHTLENLKKAQVKLIESEKMASLGLLTAGIAHEINNPINYVTANVIPLRENIVVLTELIDAYKALTPDNFDEQTQKILKLESDIELDYTIKETSELINGIEEGAKRTYNIVDGLRTFSRSDATDKQLSDVNKGIESTLSVLKSQLKLVHVDKQLESNIPRLNCQIGKLNQVFLNLINNGLQAIEEKFGLSTKQGILGIKSYLRDDEVIIEISDNGSGIPEDRQNKIFEPFYTSKPVGEGTGLGLSISYSIIEDHGGSLEFESTEGEGTIFRIKLPLSEEV